MIVVVIVFPVSDVNLRVKGVTKGEPWVGYAHPHEFEFMGTYEESVLESFNSTLVILREFPLTLTANHHWLTPESCVIFMEPVGVAVGE